MQINFKTNLTKKNFKMVCLVVWMSVLTANIIFASPSAVTQPYVLNDLNLASDSTNYTIGIDLGQEYAWIITSIRESKLEQMLGSNWTGELGLSGVPQLGYKFKVKVVSNQVNETRYLLNYSQWDCLYRTTNFSVTPDRSYRYEYPFNPQNFTAFDAVFPLLLPAPPLTYIVESNLYGVYYDVGDFTSYGGGLYIYYDRQLNINGSVITLSGMACYYENGVLDYYRIDFINGSERIECLVIETFESYHLEPISMKHEVGDEFRWVLVNYNSTVLDEYFEGEFFEKFGLLPDPERMQSIKMKVIGTSENDSSCQVEYALYDWTSLEDNFPEPPVKNGSYSFSKEPFNENRSIDGQIPLIIPQPTELFLRYGRYRDRYNPYYDIYSVVTLTFRIGGETLNGIFFYNAAGILSTLIFSRSIQIGSRTELQIAFELALYYDSPTPEYVGIEEGEQFNYDIYTNDTIQANVVFPTKNYQNASVEVIKIFGEEKGSGRTPFVANFSMKGNYNLWELNNLLIVGYVHNDSKMYFDPLVISSIGPFYLAPLFVNNKMNWTEFVVSYNNYSIIKSSNYYSVSERINGYNFYQRDYVKNITFSHEYNEFGVLTEYLVYYNDQLYHNCSLGKIIPPPIEIDTEPPEITLFIPNNEDLVSTTPLEYSLRIYEEQLNCSWITISDGIVKFTQELNFPSGDLEVEIAGYITNSTWNCLVDGSITVRFSANDSSGNLNWVEVVVIKDTTAPVVSILNLEPNDVFSYISPIFVLEVTELNLNSTYYKVNGSDKIYFTGIFGTVDQAIWDSLTNGSVSIQFFAIDEVGNLGTVEIKVFKQITIEPSPPPVEPDDSIDLAVPLGFALVPLSLGMVGVATVALIVSKKRK